MLGAGSDMLDKMALARHYQQIKLDEDLLVE